AGAHSVMAAAPSRVQETNEPTALFTGDAGGAAGSHSVMAAAPSRYVVVVNAPNNPELADLFLRHSRLSTMSQEDIPLITIEQRLRISLDQAHDIMTSWGYYDGTAQGRIQFENTQNLGQTVVVTVDFNPGAQYYLGRGDIMIAPPLSQALSGLKLPETLSEVGLIPGEAAVANDVLRAEVQLENAFHNRGYPGAQIVSSRYTLDRKNKILNAELVVNPGPLVRFGDLIPQGQTTVSESFLRAQRTWALGEPWEQVRVDDYVMKLRQSGLFQSVTAKGANSDDDAGLRPVLLTLVGAPERTVGGLITYDTNFGPGVTTYWEHRNFSGHGDRLRLEMPLWEDLQKLTAAYRYPFFKNPNQDLLMAAEIGHEDAPAYELWSVATSAGIERRLSRRLRVSALGLLSGGSITETDQERQNFIMLGAPMSAIYDRTTNVLDPTYGQRLIVSATPFTGTYNQKFNVIKNRLEAHAFIPLREDAHLGLALKGALGAIWGAETDNIPPSIRFYSGGGGSVRGYDHQLVGPLNSEGNPQGGAAVAELNAETRLRVSEDFGLVAFLDGGMVYDRPGANAYGFKNLLWGAGAGARYYTPIGPVRLDLATPLNRRPGDGRLQVYISIGQAF
ncbi:MAG: autotransporter assembly complex protein TamA, partial [Candidatus Adiutrix sp.]